MAYFMVLAQPCAWRYWEKLWRNSVRIVGSPVEIQIMNFPHTCLEHYHYNNMLI